MIGVIVVIHHKTKMKQIEVVAAIIRKGDKIFATQRGYGDYKDGWEFPGGKMEVGETPEEALRREIWEELETRITVDSLLQTVEWDYPQFHLTMHCYWSARWLAKGELGNVAWLPADLTLLPAIQAAL